MAIIPHGPGNASSGNKVAYRASLVNRSHQILKMGYDRLVGSKHSGSEEEVITGILTEAMQKALEDVGAPRWAKNFWVDEEIRVNDETRDGKRRLRIDIQVIQHQHGPRPLFRFEAKRLHDSTSRRDYLGEEGLGCFLDGRYAASDPDAGMLGYVQVGLPDDHANGMADIFTSEASRYGVAKGGGWTKHGLSAGGLQIFVSVHVRGNALSDITIFHTLLKFC
jgi:hypothetical protein